MCLVKLTLMVKSFIPIELKTPPRSAAQVGLKPTSTSFPMVTIFVYITEI